MCLFLRLPPVSPPNEWFIGKARTFFPSEALTALACLLRSLKFLGSMLNALACLDPEKRLSVETSVGFTELLTFIVGLGV
jgi:hypothetical protein